MRYDDPKTFEGETYTGMAVGGRHVWHYTDALWRERKVSPDRWEFALTSLKRRDRPAPIGSGAPLGTEYHWYLLAHQWVRKVDADTYHTLMSGVKHKIAHRRPHWRAWSDARSSERIAEILEGALRDARGAAAGFAGPLLVDV